MRNLSHWYPFSFSFHMWWIRKNKVVQQVAGWQLLPTDDLFGLEPNWVWPTTATVEWSSASGILVQYLYFITLFIPLAYLSHQTVI